MSTKRKWPLTEPERVQLSKQFAELDKQRAELTRARKGGDEDTIDDAAMKMFRENEKVMEHVAKLADRPIHDDEKGWVGLGVSEISATRGDDIYDGLIPNVFSLDDGWLLTSGDETDRPEDPGEKEYRETEQWVRVIAKTGWPGLNDRQRKWLTTVRDNARILDKQLSDWLESTR